MSNFGKLDFSVAFNPTSAFPLDARCLFNDLTSAQAAAAKAEEPGSKNTVYYYGQKLLVVTETSAQWYTIQRNNTLLADGTNSGTDTPTGYIDSTQVTHGENVLFNILNEYVLSIDYSALAFDTTEIVVNSTNTTSVLGQAILGQLVLA